GIWPRSKWFAPSSPHSSTPEEIRRTVRTQDRRHVQHCDSGNHCVRPSLWCEGLVPLISSCSHHGHVSNDYHHDGNNQQQHVVHDLCSFFSAFFRYNTLFFCKR
ncbi:hypothetical protein PFISCL1PPCAC_979, partial [Pristionchus fissidentatus]